MSERKKRCDTSVVLSVEASKSLERDLHRLARENFRDVNDVVVDILQDAVKKPPSPKMGGAVLAMALVACMVLPASAEDLKPAIAAPKTVVTSYPDKDTPATGVRAYAEDARGNITVHGEPDMKTLKRLEKAYKGRNKRPLTRADKWRLFRTRIIPVTQFGACVIGMGFSIAAAIR